MISISSVLIFGADTTQFELLAPIIALLAKRDSQVMAARWQQDSKRLVITTSSMSPGVAEPAPVRQPPPYHRRAHKAS